MQQAGARMKHDEKCMWKSPKAEGEKKREKQMLWNDFFLSSKKKIVLL